MAFQSLYRKYRPQAFAELVGQEATSTALRNALREDRVGHAYLFSGPRGTGKTTTARLLAKALNCAGRTPAGEPDNTCPSCVEITAGSSLDVVELDAASNRGVSEMRTLLERVAYRSAGGARKVYIIDEVHMLTKEASTALLKTLEEPPGHVVFVLATTDPQMVLPTIRSRTQHFEFSLLAADALANHLASVAAAEGVKTDPESLSLIARRAAVRPGTLSPFSTRPSPTGRAGSRLNRSSACSGGPPSPRARRSLRPSVPATYRRSSRHSTCCSARAPTPGRWPTTSCATCARSSSSPTEALGSASSPRKRNAPPSPPRALPSGPP